MAMGDLVKSKKLGEIEFADEHYLVRFHRDDYPYISATYIDPIIVLNDAIDTTLYEIYGMKQQIDRITHYEPETNRKMLWAFTESTMQDTARLYNRFETLEKQLENAANLRKQKMEQFHDNMLRSWNDQTIADSKFEPDDTAKADDLVPLVGVAQAAKLITRETFKSWDWFGLGRSDIPPEFDNEFLFDEIGRYFIKTHGALGAIGESIRLLVVSPDDMATEDIQEVCVANAKNGGQLLFRTVLDKKVHHEVGEHFLATSANIYLVSRR